MKHETRSEKIRLNMLVSPSVKGRIDALVERTDAESMTDVIRKALALYDEYIAVKEEGGAVLIEDKEGKQHYLRIL